VIVSHTLFVDDDNNTHLNVLYYIIFLSIRNFTISTLDLYDDDDASKNIFFSQNTYCAFLLYVFIVRPYTYIVYVYCGGSSSFSRQRYDQRVSFVGASGRRSTYIYLLPTYPHIIYIIILRTDRGDNAKGHRRRLVGFCNFTTVAAVVDRPLCIVGHRRRLECCTFVRDDYILALPT